MNRKQFFTLLSVVILGITAFSICRPKQAASVAIQSNSDLVDDQLNPIDLSIFRGKVVFINNWASWCPPCIAEMSSIQQLKSKLKKEDIVFVMVSFDENHDKAMTFMKKKGYDFQVYYPGNKYPYATESIPATFVLDKTGKVAIEQMGMADYNNAEVVEKIRLLLAK